MLALADASSHSTSLWFWLAAVAVLAVAALLFAARRRKARRARGEPPTPALRQTLPGAGLVEPALPPVEVVLPKERLERLERARLEVTKAQEALASARAAEEAAQPAAREAAQAERTRRERALHDAQRKLGYEESKLHDAEEKARQKAIAQAREAAEEAAREQAAREAAEEAARRAQSQQKLVALEAGRTLKEGLAKTRGGFMARLDALLGTGKELDEAALGELEEILFSADIGVRTASHLLQSVRDRLGRRELSDLRKVKGALREEIERILSLGGASAATAGHGGLPPLPADATGPQVVMVVGVNGTGKTTTIGKLASRLKAEGLRVLLGAGDTYRAAAGEQLDVWSERAGVPIVRGKDGSDPGAVLFDAVAKGKAEGFELVLCDTAGRLHTKVNLMDELKRVHRTLQKAHAGAPHEVLLVVDATTGQNAIAQARQFHEALGVTGFVLTKLDGTAKGGVIVGICDELKIPVRYVGIGETAADLKPFDPHEFVSALFGEEA